MEVYLGRCVISVSSSLFSLIREAVVKRSHDLVILCSRIGQSVVYWLAVGKQPFSEKKEVIMAVDYVRLWKLLLDKGMKRTDLKSEAGISSNVLARMGKNEYVSMETMEKICNSLSCNIEDIMEFKSDRKEQ